MLRRPALAAVVVVCCGAIAALEVLRFLTSSTVISPENLDVLRLTRYLPTLGVIAIAYAFRAIATDVKKLTPWSNMSGQWATGEKSILLDYINEIEILSVFRAVGRKDWAITVCLTATFVCGALVPFANSLVYVDLAASRTVPTTVTRTSVFDFDASPLVLPDGNLTIPKNYTGEKPYAHVASGREPDGNPALWTTNKYIFDRFALLDSSSTGNGTVVADVNAVSVNMNCEQVQYTSIFQTNVVSHNLVAEVASCPLPIQQSYYSSGDQTTYAWINVTQCSDDHNDLRMMATILSQNASDILTNESGAVPLVNGIVCSPAFTQQTATVSVNMTSNELVDFSLVGEPRPLDIKTSLEALWLYLINPLDTQTMRSYGQGKAQSNNQFGPYDSDQTPIATEENIIITADNLMEHRTFSGDPFMSLLATDSISDPTKLDLLQVEVEQLATEIWMQVISFLSRKPTREKLPGKITFSEERILVWEYALRVLQGLLGLLAIVCIALGSGLRPSTALAQDPGSLAATSLVLADSEEHMVKHMAQHATSSQEKMESELRDVQFLFKGGADPGQQIRMNGSPGERDDEPGPEERTSFPQLYQRASDGKDELKQVSKDDPGWRPMILLMGSKIALVASIVAIMVALALMLWTSHRLDGITTVTRDSSAAFPLVTSTILVLFGYSCAGVDGAVQTLAPFNVMRHRPNPHGIFIDFQSALGRLSELGSMGINLALIVSSLNSLIIPALKIVAAGLYVTTNARRTEQLNITLDQSLVMNLPDTFNLSQTSATIKKACQYAEWETDPSFELPIRSGIIDNLVFSNITQVSGTADDQLPSDGIIEARVPAILVDVHCEPIPTQAFNLSISYSPNRTTTTVSAEPSWSFEWYCGTQNCHDSFNKSEISSSVFDEGATPLSYQGKVAFQGDHVSVSGPPALINWPYLLHLADYSSLSQPFMNKTRVGTVEEPVWAEARSLNVSLPTIRATACYRNLTAVTVSATYIRPRRAQMGGQDILLPWRVSSFNASSIVHESSYPRLQPNWFAPPIPKFSQYEMESASSWDGVLQSNTLWPTRGSSNNFFELLAVDAEFRHKNLSALLDPDTLAQSAEHMYTVYLTQLLTELRPYAQNSSSSSAPTRELQASLSYFQPRLMQEPVPTYVLEALLALTAGFLLWIFHQFPSKAILPKPPTSIAAQSSLLAESTLIRRVRDEGVTDLAGMRKWRAFAALGWWSKSSADSTDRWRWGVDIGQDVQLQSWTLEPKASSASSTTLTSEYASLDLESTVLDSVEGSRPRNFDLSPEAQPLTQISARAND